MYSILPATKGIMAVERSDPVQREIVHKNAALWIEYSALSIGRNCGTELLENGGIAIVPACVAETPHNTSGQKLEGWTEGVIS
jgi:hypothetical protein